ncbi:hypothetical protein UFOVP826_39 [uncultured Caudovirales phage]|uniref:Uncharacterized protein n=1 Tax=uncultured Caudovirales phage TaxID=2100421 RepID=A0A6J5NZK4_9CAUD|nr:hypothetical protein UFOVP826_39 [uncultured Caudovirales phage]
MDYRTISNLARVSRKFWMISRPRRRMLRRFYLEFRQQDKTVEPNSEKSQSYLIKPDW